MPAPLVVLAAMLCLISAWLWIKSASGGGLPGCGTDSSCDAVLSSRWSRVGPLPVIALGTPLYLVLLLAAWRVAAAMPTPSPVLRNLLVATALLAGGAGLWFVALQMLVIRRLCPYCMAVHLGAILATLTVFHGARFYRCGSYKRWPNPQNVPYLGELSPCLLSLN